MSKKYIIVFILIACLGISLFFIINTLQKSTLVEPVKIEEQYKDFIVHIRIEPLNEGFQVLRSIEYTGDERIEIDHRSPLTQVSIGMDNGVFTGSPSTKQMAPGYQYHPQKPLVFDSLEKGEHTVYIHTQFFKEGNRIDIESEETIRFE